jgi:hypothetical protein
MKLIKTEMFAHAFSQIEKPHLVLVTANSVIKINGDLVMGAGAAKQMAIMWPRAEKRFGALVRAKCGNLGEYGVIICDDSWDWCNCSCGIFQTKYHYKDKSDLALMKRSIINLKEQAKKYHTIYLNFPGIGYGGLSEAQVFPLLYDLPENCIIYKKDKYENQCLSSVR